MTPKPIGYSIHARGRLRQRRITRQQVRWLLAQGTRQPIGDHLYEVRGYLGKDEAKLIVREDAARVLIITVMWIE